jgi:hypothetical protein
MLDVKREASSSGEATATEETVMLMASALDTICPVASSASAASVYSPASSTWASSDQAPFSPATVDPKDVSFSRTCTVSPGSAVPETWTEPAVTVWPVRGDTSTGAATTAEVVKVGTGVV